MSQKPVILIIEDETTIGMVIKEALTTRGFKAIHIESGFNVLHNITRYNPSLCIIDIMLPYDSGFTVAEKIISLNKNIPIIFLTAKTDVPSVLKGFSIGAEDYVKKPFSLEELIARINAVLKRSEKKKIKKKSFSFMNYHFDSELQILQNSKGVYLQLSHKESLLLKLLLDKESDILTKEEAIFEIWGEYTKFSSRRLDVYITKIRKIFSSDPKIQIINCRGIGYKLNIINNW